MIYYPSLYTQGREDIYSCKGGRQVGRFESDTN